MQKGTLIRAFLVASIAGALATPGVVYSRSEQHGVSYNNFEPNQFFTQAERDLIERVRQRIRENPAVKTYANSIQIKAEQGIIKLMGSVKTEKDKAEIGATAKKTLGVRMVDNELRMS